MNVRMTQNILEGLFLQQMCKIFSASDHFKHFSAFGPQEQRHFRSNRLFKNLIFDTSKEFLYRLPPFGRKHFSLYTSCYFWRNTSTVKPLQSCTKFNPLMV